MHLRNDGKLSLSKKSSGKSRKKNSPPGGFEPPTFWLTAKRASRLRHGGSLICEGGSLAICILTRRINDEPRDIHDTVAFSASSGRSFHMRPENLVLVEFSDRQNII